MTPSSEGAAALGGFATPARGVAAPIARARRLDLDRAKGIAILLVVFGHIVAREPPAGVEWYDQVRYLVYRFHMPFFLYLSGYVAWVSGALGAPPGQWPRLAVRRAERLLAPFLLFGLFILAGKLTAGQVVHVDNPPDGVLGGLRDLVWTTGQSPATSVWYLWVLFLASVVTPLLLRLGIGLTPLAVLGIALIFVDLPAVAYLDRFGRHYAFFVVGAWVAARQERALPLFDAHPWAWWAAFAATLAAAAIGWIGEIAALAICGIACIPALHGAVRKGPLANANWPLFFGRYSMSIYLFNTIAIGLVKAVLIAVGVGWTSEGFWLHAPALMLAGVFLPILGKHLVLRRIPILDRMTN